MIKKQLHRDTYQPYLLRYLYAALVYVYMRYHGTAPAIWLDAEHMNIIMLLYVGINTGFLFNSLTRPESNWRSHVAMVIDLMLVSLLVLHDPRPAMPTMLLLLLVTLGNGLRYGPVRYLEAAAFSTLAIALSVLVRRNYTSFGVPVDAGLTFFLTINIGLYGYLLVNRVWSYGEQLLLQEQYDNITGLLRAPSLREMAMLMIKRDQRKDENTIMLSIDIDDFDAVNDTLGYDEGTRILAEVGECIKGCLRDYDLGARLNADNFAVVLSAIDSKDANIVMNRLQQSIKTLGEKNNLPLSLSIGMADTKRFGQDYNTILEQAHQALYAAQRRGHGQIAEAMA